MSKTRVSLSELHRGTPGVPRVNIGTDAENAFFVEWDPPELSPFALRYRWWSMVDEELEDGDPLKHVEWAVGPAEVIPLDPPVKWTWHHERALIENAYAFRRYAEHLHVGQVRGAIQTRTESLEESKELDGTKYQRMRPDQLPNVYLVALVRKVQELRSQGWDVFEMGVRRKVDGLSLRTLHRRLTEAKQRGIR